MITTVGREEGQLFDPSDLTNFPCQDLRTLDQLWVKYSNGKWGFSVQKEIWQECDSPVNCNDNLKKFGDRVGWRKGGRLINDFGLAFDTQKSLIGELPAYYRSMVNVRMSFADKQAMQEVYDELVMEIGVSSLSHRLEKCNTKLLSDVVYGGESGSILAL